MTEKKNQSNCREDFKGEQKRASKGGQVKKRVFA